ncbi:uncharacterized protein LOC134101594 [Sardina pilchardus]|uniref:uncharacterized protein LOC134101594 n=1 Tax=Sardina pilchardus TaxID=27697 RepID=UPI002E100509
MDNPDRDDQHCKHSAPLPSSSPGDQEENTSCEELTTPSEEVKIGPSEERKPASLTETVLRTPSGATCEDLEKKVSALEMQTEASVDESSAGEDSASNEPSYPTKSDYLFIGDHHAKWWNWYQKKYGYLSKHDFFTVQCLEWEVQSSNDLPDDSDSDEEESSSDYEQEAREESMVMDIPGAFVPCNPVVMEVYRVAMMEWKHFVLAERFQEMDGPGLSWGLLALVCKMGGVVSGSDIAELLMLKMKTFAKAASRPTAGTTSIAMALIAGKAEEALDLAMRRGLMHHAFILGSFVGIQPSLWMKGCFDSVEDADPLKTYYQVQLGEIPSMASVSGHMNLFMDLAH